MIEKRRPSCRRRTAGAIARQGYHYGRDAVAASDEPGRVARTAYAYIPILIVSVVSDKLILAYPLGMAAAKASILALVAIWETVRASRKEQRREPLESE
jgi:hypothetical protein